MVVVTPSTDQPGYVSIDVVNGSRVMTVSLHRAGTGYVWVESDTPDAPPVGFPLIASDLAALKDALNAHDPIL